MLSMHRARSSLPGIHTKTRLRESSKDVFIQCLLLMKTFSIHLKTEKLSQIARHLPIQKADILILENILGVLWSFRFLF